MKKQNDMEEETKFEFEEEERVTMLLDICSDLEDLGENDLANQVFKKIASELKFVTREDWEEHQICEIFPTVDIRCLAFCCPATKPCAIRNTALNVLKISLAKYREMKKDGGELIQKKLQK